MYQLSVLVLNGCSLCQGLLTGLKEAGIDFEELDADLNNELARKIERVVRTDYYPIAVLDLPQASTYFFRADETERVGPIALSNETVIVGCVNTNTMLQQIKILLNK